MNSLSKIFAIILLAISLFAVPLIFQSQHFDDITQNYVAQAVCDFVDTVRVQGKITQETYSDFLSKLDSTNVLYDINLEHSHKQINPIYNESGAFTSSTNTGYDIHYSDEIIYALFERKPSQEQIKSGEREGEYHLTKGDYFTCEVKSREETLAMKLKRLIFKASVETPAIYTVYGGEVRDENY